MADSNSATWHQRILSHLSRVQSAGQFIPAIDGLRFVAIFAVLAFHWARYLVDKKLVGTVLDKDIGVLDNGQLGVQLFFSISGFILALPFARAWLFDKPRPPLSKYFLRRVTRLEPPYILNLLICFVLVGRRKGYAYLLPHLLASMVYSHNWIYHDLSEVNFVTWSLEIEVQFYILAPLIACLFAIANKTLRRAIVLTLMLAIPAALYAANLDFHLSLPGHIQYFLGGFLLADLYLTDWAERPTTHVLFDVAGFTAAIAVMFFTSWAVGPLVLTLPFLTLLFCIAAFRGPILRAILSNIWIATFGGMCYTIYLYHEMLIFYGIGPIAIKLHQTSLHFYANVALELFVVVPFVLACSAVLFALFERPFMKRDWYKNIFK